MHGNWAFTAPGTYLLDVEMLASTVDGATVTDRQPLRIFVGSGDPNTAFPIATSTSTTVTTSSAQVVPAAEAPRVDTSGAEPDRTPLIAIGAGGLAVLLAATIWLRRKRSRRGEAS